MLTRSGIPPLKDQEGLCPDMMSPDTMKRCILCGTEIEGIEDKVLSKKILSEQQYHPLGLQKKDQEEILLSQNS